MKHILIGLVACAALTACGSGGSRYSSANARSYSPPPAAVAISQPAPVAMVAPVTSAPAITEAPSEIAAPPAVMFATGPLQQACMADSRKAASSARCGCIQAAANQSLSAADQRRGVKYFSDPHALQQVRQSDNPSNERFWKAWKAFGQDAATMCANS